MGDINREVSEWLLRDTQPKPSVSQPVASEINGLRHVRGQMAKLYKKPKLSNSGGDLSAKWFVYFSFVHPSSGKFQRIKVYLDLNSYKTKTERNEYAGLLIKSITELLENGYNPFLTATEQKIGEVHTLAQAIPTYLLIKETQLRGKTVTGYKSVLKQFGEWATLKGFMERPLMYLTADEVQTYFTQSLKVRKLSATTHNSELATLRAFFTFWHKKQVIKINPADGIKRIREEVALHTIYSDKQIELITNYLKESDTPRATQLLQYIRFIYYTCIRPKELRMLTIGDIRLQTNTIIVPASVSKSGRSEPVDISPGLSEVIAAMKLDYSKPEWFLFGNQARGVSGDYSDPRPGPKPVGQNYFTKYYREVLEALKLNEDQTLYAWKHTRNVHLYMKDKDLLRIMRHNRHTDPKVTMRYLRNLGLLVDTRLEDERRI